MDYRELWCEHFDSPVLCKKCIEESEEKWIKYWSEHPKESDKFLEDILDKMLEVARENLENGNMLPVDNGR